MLKAKPFHVQHILINFIHLTLLSVVHHVFIKKTPLTADELFECVGPFFGVGV